MTTQPPKSRRATAQMVADLAGVSRSAVSRAFTKGGYVDAEKRTRIHAAAAELGYQPNALAAGLQGSRSRLVAVVSGETRNPHDTALIQRLCEALNHRGLWPIVVTGTPTTNGTVLQDTLRFPLDALVIRGGSMSDDFVERCAKLNIPMICYGRPLGSAQVQSVYCRSEMGTYTAARLLLDSGRRKLALINGPAGFYSSAERRRGCLTALTKSDLEPTTELVGDYTVVGGEAATRDVLAAYPDTDAIICANDAMAIGALGAIRDSGRRVPGDVAVIGFDDIEMAGWPGISLTTVRNPIDQTVSALVERINCLSDGQDTVDRITYIEPSLILRSTH